MKPSISRPPSVPNRLALALVCLGALASAQLSGRGMKVVTYEAFGAAGDGSKLQISSSPKMAEAIQCSGGP